MSAPAASSPSGAQPADGPPALLSHRQILTIFAGLMIGMFLAALDQTIVATSIRTIADDLDGLSLQAWATTAYLITGTISTPLYGKLSDLYGRKPLFLAAIGIFVTGSLACSFAGSMYELAMFRAFQGLGAGGLFSLALTIIGDIVAPRQRARYQGYFVAVFGTSSVLGPVAGGFFAGQAELLGISGWRWVFLVNVPLGILALVVVTRVLNIPHNRREHRIDWPGALALTAGVVPLLVVAEQGRTWGWSSAAALLCYVVGVAGLVLFVLAERRIGDDALLPLRFFRTEVFAWGAVAVFVAGAGMFGALSLLPLYLQIVKGFSPTQAGLRSLPLVLGIMSMSVASGQVISRTGRYKVWPVVGLSLMIVGIGLLSRVDVDTPYWHTALIMLVIGWGLGGNMQPLTLAIQNALPPRDMGVATASATFFRQMGGTLGTAVFLSILFGTLPTRIVERFRAAATDPAFAAALRDPAVVADPANQPVLAGLSGGAAPNLDDSSFLGSVDPVLARPVLEGFASSMSTVFLCAAVVLVIGLVAVLKMKEVPLRTQSGVEARRSAEASAAGAGATPDAGPSAQLEAAVATIAPVPVAPAAPAAEVEAAARPDVPRPWRRARPVGGDGARAVVTRGTGGPELRSGTDGGADVRSVAGAEGADLFGADLAGADLASADLAGAGHHESAPNGAVPNGAVPNGVAPNGALGHGSRGNGHPVPGVARAAVLPAAPAGPVPEAGSSADETSAGKASAAKASAGEVPPAGEAAGDVPPAGEAAAATAAGDMPRAGKAAGDGEALSVADPASRAGHPRDRLLAMLLPDADRAVALVTDAERARDAARRAHRELAAHRRDLDHAREGLLAQGLTPAQVSRLLELTAEETGEAPGGEPRA